MYCERDLCTKNIINLALGVRIKSQNKDYYLYRFQAEPVTCFDLLPVSCISPKRNELVENK